MIEYINTKYTPESRDVCATYQITPAKGITIYQACEAFARNIDATPSLRPVIYNINRRTSSIQIAFPQEIFEERNISQLISVLVGNPMNEIIDLKLLDLRLTTKLATPLAKPQQGIRSILGIQHRPLLGIMQKPSTSAKQHAILAYQAWTGGADLILDAPTHISSSRCSFTERTKAVLAMRKKAEIQTGERKLYAANITGETLEMIRRIQYLNENSSEIAMINYPACGFAALQTLRHENNILLYGHSSSHGIITQPVLAMLGSLTGLDLVHITTPTTKLYQGMPVFVGPTTPTQIPALIKNAGTNIMIVCKISGLRHPAGSSAGTRALKQAIEATMASIPLSEYAKVHQELTIAMEEDKKEDRV